MAKRLIQDIFFTKKSVPRLGPKPVSEDIWDKAIKGDKSLKFPAIEFHRSKRKLKFILGLAALIVLITGGVIFLNKFSSIAVEITPRQEFIDVDAAFSASTEPQKDESPLEVMRMSREEKATSRTTGTKQISRKASGQIIIYNAHSSQPQFLVQNTRFETADGKIYRLDKSIVVPGAKIEEGKIMASEIEATVFADKPGEDYNIGLVDFTISGFKNTSKFEKFYGRSKTKMEGGFTGEVSVVAENDIAELESSLREKIKDYLLKMAVNPKPDEFLLYDKAKQIVFDEQKNRPKPGDETKELELKESAVLFGFLLKKSDIDRLLAEKYFNPETAAAVEVVNAAELIFELKNFTLSGVTFELKGQAHFSWKIDEAGLKNDLIKERKNPDNVFQKYPAIEKAKIVFKPAWWPFISKDSSKIVIKHILKTGP